MSTRRPVTTPTSDGLALEVMFIMKELYGALPAAFWNLSKAADRLAGRGFVVRCERSYNLYVRKFEGRPKILYPILKLRVDPDVEDGEPPFNGPVTVFEGVKVAVFSPTFTSHPKLMEGLEELMFEAGSNFDKKIVLPDSLKRCTFGPMFNQEVKLPPKLQYISFGYYFNKKVHLPEGLKEVYFGAEYDQPTTLPFSLERISFGMEFNQQFVVPPRVVELDLAGILFNKPLLNLPKTLKRLFLSYCFNQRISLPEGLEWVYFRTEFNKPLELPSTIKHVRLGDRFNFPLVVPDGVETLRLGEDFCHSVDLPESIEEVKHGPLVQYTPGGGRIQRVVDLQD